jgi:hypothetical protein
MMLQESTAKATSKKIDRGRCGRRASVAAVPTSKACKIGTKGKGYKDSNSSVEKG